MKVVYLRDVLPQAEQAQYVQHILTEHPGKILEKVIFDVSEEFVDIHYTFCRQRNLSKMGGCCIGEPSSWNSAKRAEHRDTLPNSVDD